MNATVDLKRVTKRYAEIEAVREVSFDLPAGETIALVGHNGAGKTTLLKLMLGLIRPSAGTVRVLGEDPAAGQFAARRRLGYLPENVSFNMALTGRETLVFYARLKRAPLDSISALFERVVALAPGYPRSRHSFTASRSRLTSLTGERRR